MKRIHKAVIAVLIFFSMLLFGVMAPAVLAQEFINVLSEEESDDGTGLRQTGRLAGIPEFITAEMLIAAIQTQEEYGYPASVCIAQIIAESGFGFYGPGGESGQGLSELAYEYKNLFGIKGTGPAGSVNMLTGEQTSSGENYVTNAYFRVYHSYTECIEDRAILLSEVYADLIEGVTDADTFAEKIGSRWATDGQYANKLKTHMQAYNLYNLDYMTQEELQDRLENGNLGYYNGEVTEIMQTVVEIARNNTGTQPCTANMCAAWVSGVYEAAGLPYPGGDAIDMWNAWKDSGSTDIDNIPPGAIVCGSGVGSMGALYGHVGIYLGDGLVANNVGYHSIETLENWISWQTAECQGHVGWIGWVWPNGQALDRM